MNAGKCFASAGLLLAALLSGCSSYPISSELPNYGQQNYFQPGQGRPRRHARKRRYLGRTDHRRRQQHQWRDHLRPLLARALGWTAGR